MEFKGATVYDENHFFEQFMNRRLRENSPNNIMEKPDLLELLGNVEGKNILDLGCGESLFGKELLAAGATYYLGVDGSNNMIDKARETFSGIDQELYSFQCTSLESLKMEPGQFDLVISRMVFHYIEQLKPVFQNVHQSLKEDGGRFVFSVMHPVITATFDHHSGKEKRTHWVVDDYFHSGKRVEQWMDHQVVKYHRTIEEYFHLLTSCGFKIHDIREGAPRPENFKDQEEFKRRSRIPLFLLFSATKA